ncbi:protein-glutamate methylesterase [Mesorhizobium sp. LSJC285A00]|uniref:chemotaxis protein CheB n=1 Tax=unclassified Mesorhizobium TaxID=325217 RepID=UPI0003CF15E2|nr:chemotaxis protein CheB [Mesorhizobium sp. LSJC285A00]ESW89130.1 protein-glutamate methylesterase [Mesorhizobium sp. LSJC285A00]
MATAAPRSDSERAGQPDKVRPDGCENRCIVTIGASAGGVDALKRLVRDLSPDIPAALLVVQHVGPTSYLGDILGRAANMPVANASNGMKVKNGHIFVATPGAHLLLHDDHMLLRRGPRENLARPAIDPLFRSAACSFGGSVIGVVLTGSLSDGTAGLHAIKMCGGVSVVQDPGDAAVPDMPLSALQNVEIDHCVPLSEMAGLLHRLASEIAGPTPEIPSGIRLEAAIAAQEHSTMELTEGQLGTPSTFVCPECHGPLWEIEDGPITRYRCHTGHAFGADVLMQAQADDAEQALWSLLRAHQQRAELAKRTAKREAARERHSLASQMAARAAEYEADAKLIEEIIHRRTP